MKTPKVVGLASGNVYRVGTLVECETFVAFEQAGCFEVVPL